MSELNPSPLQPGADFSRPAAGTREASEVRGTAGMQGAGKALLAAEEREGVSGAKKRAADARPARAADFADARKRAAAALPPAVLVPGLGSWLRDAAASALLLELAMEWFRPLLAMSDWTDLHLLRPFLLAFALFLLPEAAGWRSAWSWLFRLAAALSIVGGLFYSSFPSPAWIFEYAGDTANDLTALLHGDWTSIGAENRTLLFLCGWMLLLVSVQSMVLWRKRALWLSAVTGIYMLALQAAAGVDVRDGLIRAVAAALALAALVRLPEVEQRLGFVQRRSAGGAGGTGATTAAPPQRGRKAWPALWLAAAFCLTAASLGGAWALALPQPALSAQSGLPPELTAWAERIGLADAFAWPESVGGAAPFAKTGYGDQDFRLGGPLRPDDGVAFIARTPVQTYWRGEAKTVYDGRGWIEVERDVVNGKLGEELPDAERLAGGSAAVSAGYGAVPAASEATAAAVPITQEVWLREPQLGRLLFTGGAVQAVEQAATSAGRLSPGTPVRLYPTSGKARVEADHPVSYYRIRTAWSPLSARLGEPDAGAAVSAKADSTPSAGIRTVDIAQYSDASTNTKAAQNADAEQQADTAQNANTAQSANTAQNHNASPNPNVLPNADVVQNTGHAVPTAAVPLSSAASEEYGSESTADTAAHTGASASSDVLPKDAAAALQLPKELPDRVTDLAREVAGDAADPLGKARAIAAYLRSNYTYSLSRATLPPEGGDFVDHFLFEDRVGYCDYFSTAMAVMLRSVGVPARWVKGFAPGEELSPEETAKLTLRTDGTIEYEGSGSLQSAAAEHDDGATGKTVSLAVSSGTGLLASASTAASIQEVSAGVHTVVVRNRNAHSWVEAYIAPYGWVPFDPTPGFSGFGGDRADSSAQAAADGSSTAAAGNPSAADEAGAPAPASLAAAAAAGAGAASADAPRPSAAPQGAAAGPLGALAAYAAAVREALAAAAERLRAGWDAALAAYARAGAFGRYALLLAAAALPALFAAAVRLLRAAKRLARRAAGPRLLVPAAFLRRGREARLARMDRLWAALFRRYGPMAPQQTLREYAAQLAAAPDWSADGRRALGEFVGLYEAVRFGSGTGANPADAASSRLAELARRLTPGKKGV